MTALRIKGIGILFFSLGFFSFWKTKGLKLWFRVRCRWKGEDERDSGNNVNTKVTIHIPSK